MMHAPNVDISAVHSNCGGAVVVDGWVRDGGSRFYSISGAAPNAPSETSSASVSVLADGAIARKRPAPEIGTKIRVRGVVVCDEGTVHLEESELVVLTGGR
jgi:hypothetical protein